MSRASFWKQQQPTVNTFKQLSYHQCPNFHKHCHPFLQSSATHAQDCWRRHQSIKHPRSWQTQSSRLPHHNTHINLRWTCHKIQIKHYSKLPQQLNIQQAIGVNINTHAQSTLRRNAQSLLIYLQSMGIEIERNLLCLTAVQAVSLRGETF